jgi:hypothetical protein
MLFPMLTAKTQYNLTNAKKYFEEHLCVGDYYDEGQRVSGQWIGVAAEQLGLSGRVRADDFLRLCENQHPATGCSPRINPVLRKNFDMTCVVLDALRTELHTGRGHP